MQITNLHIRYEDAITQARSPFVFGLTLQEVGAFTIDDAGNEMFVKKEAMALLRKAAELSRFSVYFDTGLPRCQLLVPFETIEQDLPM
jgi:vacuolar protein sorting-associated protein 13A/C